MKRMTSLWIQVQAQVSNEDVVAAEAKRDGGLGRVEKKRREIWVRWVPYATRPKPPSFLRPDPNLSLFFALPLL